MNNKLTLNRINRGQVREREYGTEPEESLTQQAKKLRRSPLLWSYRIWQKDLEHRNTGQNLNALKGQNLKALKGQDLQGRPANKHEAHIMELSRVWQPEDSESFEEARCQVPA
jgi:hypothetical protein